MPVLDEATYNSKKADGAGMALPSDTKRATPVGGPDILANGGPKPETTNTLIDLLNLDADETPAHEPRKSAGDHLLSLLGADPLASQNASTNPGTTINQLCIFCSVIYHTGAESMFNKLIVKLGLEVQLVQCTELTSSGFRFIVGTQQQLTCICFPCRQRSHGHFVTWFSGPHHWTIFVNLSLSSSSRGSIRRLASGRCSSCSSCRSIWSVPCACYWNCSTKDLVIGRT